MVTLMQNHWSLTPLEMDSMIACAGLLGTLNHSFHSIAKVWLDAMTSAMIHHSKNGQEICNVEPETTTMRLQSPPLCGWTSMAMEHQR